MTSTIRDGLYPGMPREEYEAISAVNQSLLKHFVRSPAHARWEMLHPTAPTEAMELGTAAHCAVFERERFEREYVVGPKVSLRTNAGKAAWADFQAQNVGKTILANNEWETANAISKCANAHDLLGPMLAAPGRSEVVAVWTNAETGLRCKGMMDRIASHLGWTWVLDLKTCQDARPWQFGTIVGKYQYHVQAAFYLDGLNTLARLPRRWLWCAIEKKTTFGIQCHEPDSDTLEQGRVNYQTYLRAYKTCKETGKWPSYPAIIQPLRVAKYLLTINASDFDEGVEHGSA